MPLKFEHTTERLTRRTGLILVNRFGERISLPSKINRAFRAPGSNRGFDASNYVLTIVEMLIDGATLLEDVRLFENDEAYKELAEIRHYPTSDALGDWLRRHGGTDGETRLWSVTASLIQTMTGCSGFTLDIDGTIIEANKGDALMSYKGIRGYHPLLGYCNELGLFVGSQFCQRHHFVTTGQCFTASWISRVHSSLHQQCAGNIFYHSFRLSRLQSFRHQ